MSNELLMPKATAVWLVDNTSLTFQQIAAFCGLHELEVKGIADGDVAQGIKGMDPVSSGQLSREEIERGQEDADYRLELLPPKVEVPEVKTKRGPRYTPLSRRQDRPDAISWLLRNHAELTDGQVCKLVGTTKPTIQAIRDRSHWNSANIKPVDPVTLGLCSQIDLDNAVEKAARRLAREQPAENQPQDGAPETLMPVADSLNDNVITAAQMAAEAPAAPETAQSVFPEAENQPPPEPNPADQDDDIDADSVFAKLKELKPDVE